MARRTRTWEELTERYRARLQRYGITPSYYETGGILQRARGHLPREHITRRERQPLGFSSTDYNFMKRQQKKTKYSDEEWEEFVKFYKSLSPFQREQLRARVYMENKAYIRRHRTKLRTIDVYIRELRNDYPWFRDDKIALLFYH